MRGKVELTQNEIHSIIIHYIKDKLGIDVRDQDINIEVKSKQNYKSEWEKADIRANYSFEA